MRTTVCLVRHGETDWNLAGRVQGREDVGINETGRRQAMKTANFLGREVWDGIFSSPLKRALATAEIIGGQLGMADIAILDDLMERDFGQASGLTQAEIGEKFGGREFVEQEPWDSFSIRAMRGLDSVVDGRVGQRLIVVSHGGLINAILLGLSQGKIGSGKTVLKNACISMLGYQGEWVIESYNQVHHLQ